MGKRVSFADVLADGPMDVTSDAGASSNPQDNPSLKTALSAPLASFAQDPRNHRSRKEDADLPELAARMQRFGQLQPVLVVSATLYRERFPDVEISAEVDYVIIAGNRRYAAAVMAGLTALYFLLNDALLDVDDYREAALDENLRRLDLTCIEIARTIGEWVAENTEETQQALAKRLNRSQPWVSQHLKLLTLPDVVQDWLDVRRAPLAQARAISTWPPARVEDLAQKLRETTTEGLEAPRPAITAVIEPQPPREKQTRKVLTRFRTHHGAEAFASLVCDELDPRDAVVMAQQLLGRLDDAGLDQVRALLAAPRAAAD